MTKKDEFHALLTVMSVIGNIAQQEDRSKLSEQLRMISEHRDMLESEVTRLSQHYQRVRQDLAAAQARVEAVEAEKVVLLEQLERATSPRTEEERP